MDDTSALIPGGIKSHLIAIFVLHFLDLELRRGISRLFTFRFELAIDCFHTPFYGVGYVFEVTLRLRQNVGDIIGGVCTKNED
jgi:hypothetical protein